MNSQYAKKQVSFAGDCAPSGSRKNIIFNENLKEKNAQTAAETGIAKNIARSSSYSSRSKSKTYNNNDSDGKTKTDLGAVPKKAQPEKNVIVEKEKGTYILPPFCYIRKARLAQKFQPIPIENMNFKITEPHNWDLYTPPKKSVLYKVCAEKIKSNECNDLVVHIQNVFFQCTWLALRAYSKFFRSIELKQKTVVLPAEEVSPTAFSILYRWIIADDPLLQPESIVELFKAAIFLKIELLIDQCWFYFNNWDLFNEQTAFLTYQEAKEHNLDILSSKLIGRINKFFLTLVASEEFLDLTTTDVCNFLSSDSIGVNTEIEVLMAAVRWLSYDWKNRQALTMNILNCVRFDLLPIWFLLSLNIPQDYVEFNRVLEAPEVKKLISIAKCYLTLYGIYGNKNDIFAQLLRESPTKSVNRKWIFDHECQYHRDLKCMNLKFFSYGMFLDYLDMLRNAGPDHWKELVEYDIGSEKME